MRRAAKVDDNHSEIVRALRLCGCSVQDLSGVGQGCPDLLVGRAGANFMLEVKDAAKSPSEQRLNPRQVIWHRDWRGQRAVVNCVQQALEAVGLSYHRGNA